MKTILIVNDGSDVQAIPYERKRDRSRAGRFLYYKNAAGEELLIVGTGTASSHRNLKLDYEYKFGKIDGLLSGAGNARYPDAIEGWYSSHFDFHTPEENKARISELLGPKE